MGHFFDKETTYEDVDIETDEGIYTHCIAEVWENTKTNEVSIGWYPTDKTELKPLVEED